MSLEEKINQVEAFYVSLDKDLASFQSHSKMTCLSGCSACCRSPHIEATILELLPFAFHLYKENKAEAFYDQLINTTSAVCALYKPVQAIPGKGGCGDYSYRALICRLFGSSFTRDKDGKSVMLTCKDMKEEHPEAYGQISTEAHEGIAVPSVGYYHTQLSGIDYYLSQQQYPINEAIRLALEMVINHFHYTEALGVDEKKVS